MIPFSPPYPLLKPSFYLFLALLALSPISPVSIIMTTRSLGPTNIPTTDIATCPSLPPGICC